MPNAYREPPANHWFRQALIHLHRLVDHEDDECQFDHHGFCQAHFVDGSEPGKCGVAEAREFLAKHDAQGADPVTDNDAAGRVQAYLDAVDAWQERSGVPVSDVIALMMPHYLRRTDLREVLREHDDLLAEVLRLADELANARTATNALAVFCRQAGCNDAELGAVLEAYSAAKFSDGLPTWLTQQQPSGDVEEWPAAPAPTRTAITPHQTPQDGRGEPNEADAGNDAGCGAEGAQDGAQDVGSGT